MYSCVFTVSRCRLEAECPWVREGGHRLSGQQPLLYRSRISVGKVGKQLRFRSPSGFKLIATLFSAFM